MSDKSKISYYFTRKPKKSLKEPCDTFYTTTTNLDIVNLNETDDAPSCSSTKSILHDQNEIYKENLLMKIHCNNTHQAAASHKYANDHWINAVKNHKNNNDVSKQVNKQDEKQTSENRTYLKEIVRIQTIVFLARQGVAFQDHREDDESENQCYSRSWSRYLKGNHM
jgi:hypothetical protein